MSTTKRLRTKDEELTYKRIMEIAAEHVVDSWGEPLKDLEVPESMLAGPEDRIAAIAKMVSDDIKRMAKVPL